jgi:hypothetical protein
MFNTHIDHHRNQISNCTHFSLHAAPCSSIIFLKNFSEMAERRPPPNVDGMTTLKVDNISYRAT